MIPRLNFLLFVICFTTFCTNTIEEVNTINKPKDAFVEEGKNITMTYSDSGQIKVRITADSIVRYVEKKNPRDLFPAGIHIEFLSPKGNPTSWLTSDRAIRYNKNNSFVASGRVKFYNRKNDQLLSTQLTWDEDKSILHSDKLVIVIQPERKDTTYGFGFKTNVEFNIFEIKEKTSAIFYSNQF